MTARKISGKHYIEQCIDSALNQTFRDLGELFGFRSRLQQNYFPVIFWRDKCFSLNF